MGEGSQVVKKCLVVLGRGSGKSQTLWKCRRVPQRPLDSKGMLEDEPFRRDTCPAQPGGPAACRVSQVWPIFLMSFTQEVVLQEVTELRGCAGKMQGMQMQKCLVQILLQGQGGFHGVLSFT